MAITLRKPEDNLPILEDWVTTARDIFAQGFEGHREIVELKLAKELAMGEPLKHGCFQPSKGFGRVSMLWFGVLWTWKKFGDMTATQSSDFLRWGWYWI